MVRAPARTEPVPVPGAELLMRMAVAVWVGAAILYGADRFPARFSGLLLAWPISGSILPSFTLPLHGRDATIALLRGFANGLSGFIAFFIALPVLLQLGAGRATSFAIALTLAALAVWTVHRVRGWTNRRRGWA